MELKAQAESWNGHIEVLGEGTTFRNLLTLDVLAHGDKKSEQ